MDFPWYFLNCLSLQTQSSHAGQGSFEAAVIADLLPPSVVGDLLVERKMDGFELRTNCLASPVSIHPLLCHASPADSPLLLKGLRRVNLLGIPGIWPLDVASIGKA